VIPSITIDAALSDKNLLGACLGVPETWSTWIAVLKSAFGIELNRSERRAFESIAGSRQPPAKRVNQLWCIIGRGGGKSRIAAAIAVYIACFLEHDLDPGETGFVLVLAGSKDQAQAVFNYAAEFIRRSPILRKLISNVTAHEIRLTTHITIAVHTNSFRLIRGRTLLGVVFDEVAYWRDELSANPDLETFRAVRPSLARTGGMLVGISSPYRKAGLLHQRWKDHFSIDSEDILVVKGGTSLFNPTISAATIAKEAADDPEAARSEWEAEFRSDIGALFDSQVIDDAVDYGRPLELPPRSDQKYFCFVDAASGRHDAFTLCLGHCEGKKEDITWTCDVIRGRHAPFDPRVVAREYAALAKQYGVQKIIGDHFAPGWVSGAFNDVGARYESSPLPKSQLYLESLPFFNRGAICLPHHTQTLRELKLLERRTHRSGRDSVDHGSHGSDDYANVVAGGIYIAAIEARKPKMRIGYGGPGHIHWVGDEPPQRPRFIRISEQEMIRLKETGQW
jgi:hypothetical protein